MARTPISVSKLADYAADAYGFEQRRGDVRSKEAAEYGTVHHDSLGRKNRAWIWVFAAVAVLVLLAVFAQ